MKTALQTLDALKDALTVLEATYRRQADERTADGDTLLATVYRAQADGVRDSLAVVQDELYVAIAQAKLAAFNGAFGDDL